MKKEVIQNIIESKIANGNFNGALEDLLRIESPEIRRQSIILSSRIKGLRQSQNMGLLRHEDVNIELNQINSSILEMVASIPEQTVINEKVDKKLLNLLDQKKGRLEYFKTIVTLLTSIIALVVALFGAVKSVKNSIDIDKITPIAKDFKVFTPIEGDSYKQGTISMTGILKQNIPKGKELRVFAKQLNYFYLMKGEIEPSIKDGKWSFDVYLGISGDFKLLVYMLDKPYAEELDLQLSNVNAPPLNTLDSERSEKIFEISKINITK